MVKKTKNIQVVQEQSNEWTNEQKELIKNTIAKGATDDELKLFLYLSKKAGLDPLAKQIHFTKRKNNKTGTETMVVITGIDGYRVVAERSGCYAGSDDPKYEEGSKFPKIATVTVYKMVNGQRCAFSASARWSEYAPDTTKPSGAMWAKMPYLMLGKVAEALALRKAFPNDLSGIYITEEMDGADNDHKQRFSGTHDGEPKDEPKKEQVVNDSLNKLLETWKIAYGYMSDSDIEKYPKTKERSKEVFIGYAFKHVKAKAIKELTDKQITTLQLELDKYIEKEGKKFIDGLKTEDEQKEETTAAESPLYKDDVKMITGSQKTILVDLVNKKIPIEDRNEYFAKIENFTFEQAKNSITDLSTLPNTK